MQIALKRCLSAIYPSYHIVEGSLGHTLKAAHKSGWRRACLGGLERGSGSGWCRKEREYINSSVGRSIISFGFRVGRRLSAMSTEGGSGSFGVGWGLKR